jgi:hypothetical protein
MVRLPLRLHVTGAKSAAAASLRLAKHLCRPDGMGNGQML